jgi:hypothetical protein
MSMPAKVGNQIDNLIGESEFLNFAIPSDDQRYTQSAAEGPLLASYDIQAIIVRIRSFEKAD